MGKVVVGIVIFMTAPVFSAVSNWSLIQPEQIYPCRIRGVVSTSTSSSLVQNEVPLATGDLDALNFKARAFDPESTLMDLEIQEFLVPQGPMLPAYRHEYYLQIKTPKVRQPLVLKLEYKNHIGSVINVYQSVRKDGLKTHYAVQHNMVRDVFTVRNGTGTMRYYCRAETI